MSDRRYVYIGMGDDFFFFLTHTRHELVSEWVSERASACNRSVEFDGVRSRPARMARIVNQTCTHDIVAGNFPFSTLFIFLSHKKRTLWTCKCTKFSIRFSLLCDGSLQNYTVSCFFSLLSLCRQSQALFTIKMKRKILIRTLHRHRDWCRRSFSPK